MIATATPIIRRDDERRGHQRQTPQTETLLRDAHAVIDACGLEMSPSRVRRIVRDYTASGIQGRGFAFVSYLLNTVQLTAQQRRDAMNHPDIARVIAYADPTGETAVHNVMRAPTRRAKFNGKP